MFCRFIWEYGKYFILSMKIGLPSRRHRQTAKPASAHGQSLHHLHLSKCAWPEVAWTCVISGNTCASAAMSILDHTKRATFEWRPRPIYIPHSQIDRSGSIHIFWLLLCVTISQNNMTSHACARICVKLWRRQVCHLECINVIVCNYAFHRKWVSNIVFICKYIALATDISVINMSDKMANDSRLSPLINCSGISPSSK